MSLRIDGLDAPLLDQCDEKYPEMMLLSHPSFSLFSLDRHIVENKKDPADYFSAQESFMNSTPLPPHFETIVENALWRSLDEVVSGKLGLDTALELQIPLIITVPVSNKDGEIYGRGYASSVYIRHIANVLDSFRTENGSFASPVYLLPTNSKTGVIHGHTDNVHMLDELEAEQKVSPFFESFSQPDNLILAGGEIGRCLATSARYLFDVAKKKLFVSASHTGDCLHYDGPFEDDIVKYVRTLEQSKATEIHQAARNFKRWYKICGLGEELQMLNEYAGRIEPYIKLPESKLL